jgi:hypothetical protein
VHNYNNLLDDPFSIEINNTGDIGIDFPDNINAHYSIIEHPTADFAAGALALPVTINAVGAQVASTLINSRGTVRLPQGTFDRTLTGNLITAIFPPSTRTDPSNPFVRAGVNVYLYAYAYRYDATTDTLSSPCFLNRFNIFQTTNVVNTISITVQSGWRTIPGAGAGGSNCCNGW